MKDEIFRENTLEYPVRDLRLHPTVLTNRIVDTVFVVSVAEGVTSHVGSKLEGVVTVLKSKIRKG